MRHRKAGIKLNRTSSHRSAMFRNMVTSLFKYNRIKTTDVKAKELRRWADKLITLAKRGDLHAKRQALAIIREKTVVYKLFDEAAEKYGSVNGGYTRIIKIGRRAGDAAPLSLIELISTSTEKEKKKVGKKKTKPAGKETKRAKKKEVKEVPEAEASEEVKEASEEEPSAEPAAEIETAPEEDPISSETQKDSGEVEKPEQEKNGK